MGGIMWGVEAEHRLLRVNVLVNGVPIIYTALPDHRIRGIKLNPWILAGTNTVEVQLGRLEDDAAIEPDAMFRLVEYQTEHGSEPGDEVIQCKYQFDRDELDLVERGMTLAFEGEFEVAQSEAFGRWAWQDAKPIEAKERVAIEALVMRLHRALRTRDEDAVLAEMPLRFEELGRSIGIDPAELEQDLRRELRPLFASDEWQMEPLDVASLQLLPSKDGRVVRVDGPSETPVLEGTAGEDNEPLAMSLAVSHIGGKWVVVR